MQNYLKWPLCVTKGISLATFTSPVLKVATKISNLPTATANEGERLLGVKNGYKLFPAVTFTM